MMNNMNLVVKDLCKSYKEKEVIKDLNLTLEKPRSIGVPGIKEFPLTLECKVIYRQAQDPSRFSDEILERYYPEDAGGIRDPHIVYYGYILDSYLIV